MAIKKSKNQIEIMKNATRFVLKMMTSNGHQNPTTQTMNNGYCGDWAKYVCLHLKGSTEPTREMIEKARKVRWHTWVIFEGLHYDSECLEGVDNFMHLPL